MIQPLNSPLEVGLRSLFLLADQYPSAINIDTLTAMDFYLLYSDTLDGPPSIFPDIPDRLGELGLKRGLIQDGLHLMQVLGFAEPLLGPSGIEFRATETTASFLDLFTEELAQSFRESARWVGTAVLPSLGAERSSSLLGLLSDWQSAIKPFPSDFSDGTRGDV